MTTSLVFQPVGQSSPTIPTTPTGAILQYTTIIEWLDWGENIVGDYTTDVIDGNVDVDSARDVRRTFSLVMNNSAGLYLPNGARNNMGVKVRIKRGVTGGTSYSRGIFVLSDPEALHKGAEKKVSLAGQDKWALLNGDLGGTLTETTVITSGTNVAEAIMGVASDGGETKFAFDVCAVTTPYTITKEPGTTRADLIKELALIASWEVYYDVDGYLRFTNLIDPLQQQVVADLSVGGTYRNYLVSSSYKPEWSKIRNYWKVIGYSDQTTGSIFSGTCQDNNPDSPTNTATPTAGVGFKPEVITDTNLTTNELCELRAAYELRNNLNKIDCSEHEILPMPWLNEGNCIQLEDSAAGITDDKYQIQSISEPLGLGLTKIKCWKVVRVFEEIATDLFTTDLGDWVALASGSIDVYGVSGNNCMRKTTSADPNGGYRPFSKNITDWELILYTRRDATGAGNNSYSVTDLSGNGYGISVNYGSNQITVDGRTGFALTTLDTASATLALSTWYTLRLIKIGSNITGEIYTGKVTEFTSPLAVIDTVESTYTSFAAVAVNGGYDFYTDEVKARRLL